MSDLTGKEVTPAMQAVLDFLVEFQNSNPASPTIREIAERTGDKSPNGITGKLDSLEKRGLIKREGNGKSRSIRLLGKYGKRTIEGKNSLVSMVGDDSVLFVIFNGTKILKNGIESSEKIVKMAEVSRYGIDQTLPVIEKAAKLAEWFAWEMIPAHEKIVL